MPRVRKAMSEPGVQFERRCAFEDALLYGVRYKYYWSLIKESDTEGGVPFIVDYESLAGVLEG